MTITITNKTDTNKTAIFSWKECSFRSFNCSDEELDLMVATKAHEGAGQELDAEWTIDLD